MTAQHEGNGATPAVEQRRASGVDKERIQAAVREIILAVGEDPEREGLRGTPRRIADMYEEIFAGLRADPGEALGVVFHEDHDEMVILRDIPFYSLCEHHLLPFHGVAHVGYIPRGAVVGISKIARVVETFARRPQVQERLTGQIADCILERLNAKGVAVALEAEHLCMTMRGIKKPGSTMVTSAMRGTFRQREETRAEFLSLVRHG
ncbi:MAG TPA: GTP cyclohydrolase I FolE [Dehalococcoidia bacterium]|nr:GTP cyclohydrolase I FolE [Dehalococcoidia bacterium]